MSDKYYAQSGCHFFSRQCIFNESGTAGTIPIPIFWVLIIDVVNGVGNLFVLCSLFEFMMAQKSKSNERNYDRPVTHHSWYWWFGKRHTCHDTPLLSNSHFQLCVLWYYRLMLLILVVYVVLAKCYKLRERERDTSTYRP